jgi:hypothetical protein
MIQKGNGGNDIFVTNGGNDLIQFGNGAEIVIISVG